MWRFQGRGSHDRKGRRKYARHRGVVLALATFRAADLALLLQDLTPQARLRHISPSRVGYRIR